MVFEPKLGEQYVTPGGVVRVMLSPEQQAREDALVARRNVENLTSHIDGLTAVVDQLPADVARLESEIAALEQQLPSAGDPYSRHQLRVTIADRQLSLENIQAGAPALKADIDQARKTLREAQGSLRDASSTVTREHSMSTIAEAERQTKRGDK